MYEKQFPQIPSELVSLSSYSISIMANILKLPEMCGFDGFEDLFFIIKPEMYMEDISAFNIHFLTDRDQ